MSSKQQQPRGSVEGTSPADAAGEHGVSKSSGTSSPSGSSTARRAGGFSHASLAARERLPGEGSTSANLLPGSTPPKKTVSFSHLEPGHIMSTRAARAEDTESSADERTGMLIASKPLGRNYSTVEGSSAAQQATGVDEDDPGVGIVKRRKGKKADKPEDGEINETWWGRLIDKFGSVELDNKGSVARDHLAIERTFLAWLRTSLSFASIGIAVTQLFRLNITLNGPVEPNHPAMSHLRKVGKPLGALFIGISILILFLGFHRYFESQHYVIRGKFPASRGSIFIVAIVAAALIVSSLVVVLAIGGSSSIDLV